MVYDNDREKHGWGKRFDSPDQRVSHVFLKKFLKLLQEQAGSDAGQNEEGYRPGACAEKAAGKAPFAARHAGSAPLKTASRRLFVQIQESAK